ncbi:MAG: RNA polymerase sigma factor, partial [Planctomycetota bacterium]|jgi:DNA-directed RNA polymerase specialized sigma24 family protein
VALDSLSDNERLAIHLYYIDTNPQQAAAAVLGLSRSGFYKLLARARGHLARLMREVEKR